MSTSEQHHSVFKEPHSDRAHERYLAWFPERTTTRNGQLYPFWGSEVHLLAVPELIIAQEAFQAWKNYTSIFTNLYGPMVPRKRQKKS